MAKINEDARGLFVELWKDSFNGTQHKPKQISWLTINPGSFRGNHYHKKTYETFILIEGECEAIFSWPSSKEELEKYGWNGLTGNQVKMKLYEPIIIAWECQHSFFSRGGAKLLVISDSEFDSKDPDTYVY